MKLNKSSIFALMTLGGLMAFGPVASAQDQPKPDAPAPGGRRPNVEKTMEILKLTDDQKEKVKPILKDQAEKMKALRDDTSVSAEDKRPKMKEIREATDAKLKPILTDDQFAQYKKMTQMAGRRRQGAGNPPATPPPATPPSTDNK